MEYIGKTKKLKDLVMYWITWWCIELIFLQKYNTFVWPQNIPTNKYKTEVVSVLKENETAYQLVRLKFIEDWQLVIKDVLYDYELEEPFLLTFTRVKNTRSARASLNKIAPSGDLFGDIVALYQKYYSPSQFVTIDEVKIWKLVWKKKEEKNNKFTNQKGNKIKARNAENSSSRKMKWLGRKRP